MSDTSSQLVSGPLRTERQPDGRRRLLRDLIIEVDREIITVPEGTITDFSSIPWFGRILVRWSRVDVAGVVHDWLYERKCLSRRRADRIWRLAAQSGDHSANAVQAWIAWTALRLFGWIFWHEVPYLGAVLTTAFLALVAFIFGLGLAHTVVEGLVPFVRDWIAA